MNGWTKEELQQKKAIELKEIARNLKVKGYSRMRKAKLISEILKKQNDGEKKLSSSEKKNDKVDTSVAKSDSTSYQEKFRNLNQNSDYELVDKKLKPIIDKEKEKSLPESYNMTIVNLLPVSPDISFAYWDINFDEVGKMYHDIVSPKTVIKLFKKSHKIGEFIQVFSDNINLMSKNYYLRTEPSSSYYVEIGISGDNGYRRIAKSNVIQTPNNKISDKSEEVFITVPFEKPVSEFELDESTDEKISRITEESREEYTKKFKKIFSEEPYTNMIKK